MQDRLVRYQPAPGLQTLLTPQPGVLDFITFSILHLAAGERWTLGQPDQETVLVLLSGDVEFQSDGQSWRAQRAGVFAAEASSLLAPAGTQVEITAHAAAEVAVASAPSARAGRVIFLGPETIHARTVGRDNWQRTVKTLVDVDTPAEVLVVGETFNPPGNWSSYPPHRHDYDRPPEEIAMEEVYFYRVEPSNGFGFQRIYTADRRVDHTWCVEHNCALPIYEGYHPVVAAGGYQLYYLWVLAGKTRQLVPYTDPEHAWIFNAH